MDLPLFEQVSDLLKMMAPAELGEMHVRSHRRGVKVWFNTEKPPKEHYEAQQLARHHVDGKTGMAVEIGFHAENRDEDKNQAAIDALVKIEKKWRTEVGPEAEVASFFGAPNWRRISEAWIEPDLEDPEIGFEIASRLVDYLTSIEPCRS